MLEYEQNSTFSTLAQIHDRELHEECGVFGVFGVQNKKANKQCSATKINGTRDF